MELDLRQRISTRQQADSDERLIELWLHGRSRHIQRAYRRDVGKFLSFTAKRVGEATLGDLQDFADTLEELAPASRVRVLSAVKSLMTFGHQVGYLRWNVGASLRIPSVKNTIGERILPENDVHRIINVEPNSRNRVMLRLLYAAGLRLSEVVTLRWRDLAAAVTPGR